MDTPILSDLVGVFWTNVKMQSNGLVSKVIIQEVVANTVTIVATTRCPRYNNYYYEGLDELYALNGTFEHNFYDENFKREYIRKEIIYKELCSYDKILHYICYKTFLHMSNIRDHITELRRFSIYHMMIGLPFNLSHIPFFSFIRWIKNLDKDVLNCYCYSLMYRLIIEEKVLEHLISPNFLVSVRNNISVNGVSRGQKFNINNEADAVGGKEIRQNTSTQR